MLARLIACSILLTLPAVAQERADERSAMVATIERLAAETGVDGGVIAPAVRDAMLAVPRHAFVPRDQVASAYENRPLPIGFGQTISQPYIVALMTQMARPAPGLRMLEIGTGSGYQAAVLAELGVAVHTIEIVPQLARSAAAQLEAAGYGAVEARPGDGYDGWAEAAPFDAILVTAAATHVPPPLVAQLAPGGRMIIPVGPPFQLQTLLLVEKDAAGAVSSRALLPVSFVPLTGRQG